MELIFKRILNVLTVFITVGLFYVVGNYNGDNANGELDKLYWAAAMCYGFVLAVNYIFLGSATLWHKNVNKKIG